LTLPVPTRGSVIRYSYLWFNENAEGREEGKKDRPALVLALTVREVLEETLDVLVLAITHTRPAAKGDAIPLPESVKRRLGLDDDEPSWIVTTEGNRFIWPGPDIRPVPGQHPPTVTYGKIPGDLLQQVAQSFLQNLKKQKQKRLVERSI
jgi:hypothetical protein